MTDSNLLVMADAPLASNDVRLLNYLGSLKQQCQADFAKDLIWVTLHPIERIIDGDP